MSTDKKSMPAGCGEPMPNPANMKAARAQALALLAGLGITDETVKDARKAYLHGLKTNGKGGY